MAKENSNDFLLKDVCRYQGTFGMGCKAIEKVFEGLSRVDKM